MAGGRPSDIDRTIGERRVEHADGTFELVPVTVSERIIGALRAGNYPEQAAAAAGINKTSLYEWQRIGARATAAVHKGHKTQRQLTAHERRCILFSNAVAEAQATWEVAAVGRLEQLGRGGHEVVTITEKIDGSGNLTERTTKTETLAPNAQVLEWRLTRMHPDRYSQRVEVTGAAGGPLELSVEERADSLADQAAAFLAREHEAAAAEAKAKRKPKRAPRDAPRAPAANGTNGEHS